MSERFIRKLETFSPLSEVDRQLIASVTRMAEIVDAGRDLVLEGDAPSDTRLIDGGFAYRYKLIRGGRRQIIGYLFPGDIGDLHASMLDVMDHGIATLTSTRVVRVSRRDMNALLERPAIARALLLAELANESIAREWLANLGGNRAESRLAHLFCDWHSRLALVGLGVGGQCDLPLTQTQIGDTLGMTSVHVNRSLQSLRERGLISLRNKVLVILDAARLSALGGFTLPYLHAQNTDLVRGDRRGRLASG